MVTTIQVSEKLLKELKERKMYAKESYEDIIWDLLEDTKELSDETVRQIEIARRQIREGRVHTHAEVKKRFGL